MTAVADELKKDEKPLDKTWAPKNKLIATTKDFPESVVIREWDKQGKQFIQPLQAIAKMHEYKGEIYWTIVGGSATPKVGSEIKHGDTVWVVKTLMPGISKHVCICEKRMAENKP